MNEQNSLNAKLLMDKIELRSENKALREALKFYADIKNWGLVTDDDFGEMQTDDLSKESFGSDISDTGLFGGRRAREATQGEPETEAGHIKDFDDFMSKDSIYRCKNCDELVNEFDYYDRYREIGCPSCDCMEFVQISKAIQGEPV